MVETSFKIIKTISKIKEDIKNNQMEIRELKNTIMEIKKNEEGKKISELKDRAIAILKSEPHRENIL